jgi:hypothetical protein
MGRLAVDEIATLPKGLFEKRRLVLAAATSGLDNRRQPDRFGSVGAVHFQVGDSIRSVGGRNADYVGIELKYGW